MSTHYFIF